MLKAGLCLQVSPNPGGSPRNCGAVPEPDWQHPLWHSFTLDRLSDRAEQSSSTHPDGKEMVEGACREASSSYMLPGQRSASFQRPRMSYSVRMRDMKRML